MPDRRRRMRHELDQRVRVRDDPDAGAHGLPASHRILSARLGPERTRRRLPFPPMPSGKKSREARRDGRSAAAGAVEGLRRQRARQASPRALAIAGDRRPPRRDRRRPRVRVQRRAAESSGLPKDAQAIGQPRRAALARRRRRQTMLKGIPQNGPHARLAERAGDDDGVHRPPVPVCQEFETQVLPDIVKKYMRTKKVKIDVEPWAFIGNDSFRGRDGMIAAAKQNKALQLRGGPLREPGHREHRLARPTTCRPDRGERHGMKIHAAVRRAGSAFVKKDAANDRRRRAGEQRQRDADDLRRLHGRQAERRCRWRTACDEHDAREVPAPPLVAAKGPQRAAFSSLTPAGAPT